ncbi:MAG: streptomycin biosynthesis protein StrI [Planctomycetaceae bacterium]|jgi:predicted dehydrogenase|nr:streptomycin biosynthesis protein StrI [Planctomycetaceae bacterium]
MSETTRREFLKETSRVAAASTLVAAATQHVHAAESNTVQVALVGCGGRGTGAVANALAVKNGPIKLVAMADVFQDRLSSSFENAAKKFPSQVDVPAERQFVSFDGYKSAMDCLRPGDVVILATPPAFRWVHFTYAIEKGLNVFMEKPVTVDGPTTGKMLKLAEESVSRNLKVGVGLMWRHCQARGELHQRIKAGEIGELIAMRTYRMAGPTGSAATGPKREGISELLYQIRQFHAFLWASGGAFSDFLIHSVDECCWMKNAWPIRAQATGGRHYRGDTVDQNFDSYSVEYTFADGTKLFLDGRTIPGCHDEFASYAHGTNGSAVISNGPRLPAQCSTYKGTRIAKEDLAWRYPSREPNPYQLEWDHLIDAIRKDKPYNEVKRGAEASLVTSMGRMAAHTGQVVTYDEMLNCEHEFAPDIDKLTMTSRAPTQAGSNGKYPVPLPGLNQTREY